MDEVVFSLRSRVAMLSVMPKACQHFFKFFRKFYLKRPEPRIPLTTRIFWSALSAAASRNDADATALPCPAVAFRRNTDAPLFLPTKHANNANENSDRPANGFTEE
jgi:hypothetical protein